MIVVSNTTPILSLAKIGQIHLLKNIFGQVYVPKAVYDEITVHGKGKPGHDILVTADYISVKQVKSAMAVGLLKPYLDDGEAESLVLAKELNADMLLLDEKKLGKLPAQTRKMLLGRLESFKRQSAEGLFLKLNHAWMI